MRYSAKIKLPKPNLPLFSVNYVEWTSFFALFKGAVIDISSLQGSQNLQYLKASVKGDVAKLLSSIPVADHNFDIAMNTLINRYENKRIIIRTYPHSIFSYRSLTTDNSKELRNLIEAMHEHRLALRNLGEPVNSQDIYFVYLISEKLPRETKNNGSYIQRARNLRSMQSSYFFRGTCTSTRSNSAKWIWSNKILSEREPTTFAHTFGEFRATMRML